MVLEEKAPGFDHICTLRHVFPFSLLDGLHSLRQEEGLPHSQTLKDKTHIIIIIIIIIIINVSV